MIAVLSPNGQNLRFGDEPPLRLLVATLRGVSVLERASPDASWIDRGRTLDGHHCGSLMIEPRRGGVFAGMHDGGLYFSGDGGETWELRAQGLTEENVFSIGYAHRGDDVALYAGTEPATVFRSDDYGRSWRELPGIRGAKGSDKWVFPVTAAPRAHQDDDDRSARSERHLCRHRTGRFVQDDRRRRIVVRDQQFFKADRLDVSRRAPGHRRPGQFGRAVSHHRHGHLPQPRRGSRPGSSSSTTAFESGTRTISSSRRSTAKRSSWPAPRRIRVRGGPRTTPTRRS